MDCGEISPRLRRLRELGAQVDRRIGSIPGDLPAWERVYRRIRRIYTKTVGNPFSGLFRSRPDILLYVGTAYSIADDHKLIKLIRRGKAAFFINVQLNREENGAELTGLQIKRVHSAYTIARKIFFVSERNKLAAEKATGFVYTQASVVRNPVNIDSTSGMPLPQDDKIQFAMVGNLRLVHKGQEVALEVLSAQNWKARNWHLNIYGTGEDEQRLRDLVDFFRLENYVTFHGRVSNIRDVWSRNHALLMPSRMEGMPLAVVEAMLCGRPVVVTDVGGSREWIEEGRQGFIAETPTVEAFGRAMERAWEVRADWDEIGYQAHEKAMKLYDPRAGETLLRLMIANS